MIQWINNELKLLEAYENLSNEYAAAPEIVRDSGTEQKLLVLEGKLLIANKDVIGYLGSDPVGIFSFNEALAKERYYIEQGKIFTYHPVNFNSMKKSFHYK